MRAGGSEKVAEGETGGGVEQDGEEGGVVVG